MVEKTFLQVVPLLSPLCVETSIRYVVVTYSSLTFMFSQTYNNMLSKMIPELCYFLLIEKKLNPTTELLRVNFNSSKGIAFTPVSGINLTAIIWITVSTLRSYDFCTSGRIDCCRINRIFVTSSVMKRSMK